MRDARGEAEIRSLREALCMLGERHEVGLVVATASGAIVFATPRAHRLFGTRLAPILPPEIQPLVEAVLAAGDGGRSHGEGRDERIALVGSRNSVNVKATRLAGTPRNVLLILEEELPREDITQRLVERYGLSARSIRLVQLASRGLKNREIGACMKLSEASVKTYMHALFRDLGVRNRAELVALAERLARRP